MQIYRKKLYIVRWKHDDFAIEGVFTTLNAANDFIEALGADYKGLLYVDDTILATDI